MKAPSHRFFENTACRYYPCHKGEEAINCLFCFCPLYGWEDCGGFYTMISGKDGKPVKDCSQCLIPHQEEGYAYILSKLQGVELL